MRNALINEWQAAGYLLLLTGLLTYAAAVAPSSSAAFGLGAGATLLAPLGLSQACIHLRRPGLAYYFALQAAVIYLMLIVVGGTELLAAPLLNALDGLLLATALAVLGAAAISAGHAALTLRAVAVAASLHAHSARVLVGGGYPDAASLARPMV
jgi:hypothetical protein